jgi:protease II
MRDTSDPDLQAFLAAENAYADAFVGSAGGGGLRARLAAEMRARLPASAATPPQPWGPWFVSRCVVVHLFYVYGWECVVMIF